MSVVQVVPETLEALEDGGIIRRVVAGVLRVAAVIGVLVGVAGIVALLKFTLGGGSSTEMSLGGIGLAALVLIAVVVIAQILWCRARSIEALGDSPFTVIPIVSVLLRATGEVYAAFSVIAGIGAALFTMIVGSNPGRMLGPLAAFMPESDRGGGVLGGIAVLLTAVAGAFAVILISYFLAEFIVVVADIARNIRLLVAQAMRPQTQPPRP